MMAVMAVLLPSIASAQSPAASVDATGVDGAVFGGAIVFIVLLTLVSLGVFVFWVLMVIDCLKRDWPGKVLWLILLVGGLFLGINWLAAVFYFFMVKKPNLGLVPPAVQAPLPPQPPTAAPTA